MFFFAIHHNADCVVAFFGLKNIATLYILINCIKKKDQTRPFLFNSRIRLRQTYSILFVNTLLLLTGFAMFNGD